SPYRNSSFNLYRYCTGRCHYTVVSESFVEPPMSSFASLSASALPAGILFALVTTITPGPNNTMLLASGVNFGFRRTLPHILGISAGVALLMLSVGFGLGEAFHRWPLLYTVLETASVFYLLYLAWKIATSGQVQ